MTDRQQWHEERATGIGSSDAAAILGVSPYASPYAIWAQKTGRMPPLADAPHLEQGRRMERIIAEWYADLDEAVVCPHDQSVSIQHATIECMRATPDYYITMGCEELLEIKWVPHGSAQWRMGPPLHVQVQIQHQMAVTGMAQGVVCWMLPGQAPQWQRYARSERFIAYLEETCQRWWEEHVIADLPPEVDDHRSTTLALNADRPDEASGVIGDPDLDDRFIDDREAARAAKKDYDSTKNTIKALMRDGGFTKATMGSGTYTWSCNGRLSRRKR